MKAALRNFTRCALVLIMCWLPLLGFAQDTVAAYLTGAADNGVRQPLREILSALAGRHGVSFNYDSDLLQEVKVKVPAGTPEDGQMEEVLGQILAPAGLKYVRISPRLYVIRPADSGGGSRADATAPGRTQQSGAGITSPFLLVSGRVTGEDGTAMPGVNILVKGTSTGTITDADGRYSLNAEPNATLLFSFIGYTSQEVPINGRSTIDVTLKADVKQLGEVVVTALGIKKEAKKLGYATATVAPEQITINRTPNFMNALQGKMAGVNITSLGTGPAGTSKIRIRGQSSFGGQNSPLIVINGVPVDNTNFGANPGLPTSDGSIGNRGGTAGVSDGGDGLGSINPDDIESMTVLKGATAAALYGSRAKDGVIMITTKTRGTGKGIGVEWNTNFTVDQPLDFTDFQYEYGQGEFNVRPTAANPTSGVWSFGERFQPGMTQVLFDGVVVPYEPQRNQVRNFYRNGNTWTNTVTISSGGEKGGFSLSLSNMDNTSIVPNSDYNRKTINLGFTQNLSKKLNVSGSINYSREDNRNPPQIAEQDLSTPTTLFTLANSMPLWLLKEKRLNANGDEFVWSRFTNRTNPYFATIDRFNRITRDRIFGNLTARYNFTDWLYLQGRIGQDYYARDQEFNFPTGLASLAVAPSGFVNGRFIQEARRFREVNADFLLGANRTFGRFGIDLTLGGNQMYRRFDLNSVEATDFVVRGLYTVMNSRIKDPLYSLSERKVNSLYGAAEFSYNDFLFVNVTARNDWFSTLSPANRSILYPSVTGSFVFSQVLPALPQWFTFGKLRAAYAEVGSDTDVSPYANSLYYRTENNLFPNSNNQPQPVGVINTSTVPNPNLRPMRISEMEFGLELKFLDNRIGLDLAYYNKLTSDQILQAQVSDASGYINRLINVGQSRNTGVEMLVNLVPIRTGDFEWNASFNGSYNQSEVLRLLTDEPGSAITMAEGLFIGELRQVVGKPLGQLYGWGYRRDAQGRIVHDNSGRPMRSDAQINFGTAIPVWVGGFTNAFNYRGILLSFLIDFKLGHKLLSGTNHNAWRHGLHKGTLPGRAENAVIGEGVNQNGEINTTPSTSAQAYYETVRGLRLAEPFLYNAGFWKLRQITLGYDFTRYLPAKLFVKGLRVNAIANNVAILKKWVDNIDPESFGFSSDNLVGLESTGLPTSRSIGFNLNVRF